MSKAIEQGALILSTDTTAFDAGSDTVARMRDYATLYGVVHILVCSRGVPQDAKEVFDDVWAYPCGYTNRLLGLVRAFHLAHRLARDLSPGVIIAQDAFMFGLIAVIIGRRHSIPVVVGVYGTDIHDSFVRTESLKHRFYAALAKRVLRRADAIQTDGPETVERLRQEYGARVFFKPMFPSNVAELTRVTRSAPETPFRVLFVGRFVPQKNIPLLAEVIHETARRNDGIVFSIVGDGPEKRGFIEEMEKRSLQDKLEDRGVLSRTEILDAYSNHHILLITSRYEGFPRVFMEAALTGMPIVTTQVGGIAGLIEDGVTGFVVSQGMPAGEIAEKIIALANDRALLLRMSRALKERWRMLYGGTTVLDYQRPIKEYLDSHKS